MSTWQEIGAAMAAEIDSGRRTVWVGQNGMPGDPPRVFSSRDLALRWLDAQRRSFQDIGMDCSECMTFEDGTYGCYPRNGTPRQGWHVTIRALPVEGA